MSELEKFVSHVKESINEGNLGVGIEYNKSKKFRINLKDGRSSAWTDEAGITQELNKLGTLSDRESVDSIVANAKASILRPYYTIINSEKLRSSDISFK